MPTLRSIDPRQREAAALLGASPGAGRREIDLPIVSRGLAVAAGVRVRDLARRVRRDRVPRTARPADASGRDLPLPRTARGAERRAGVRARRRAHGGDGRVGARSSSACACAAAGGSDASRRGRQRRVRRQGGARRRVARRRDGETVTVLGPSGSGKTTLLRVVAGLQAPDSGTSRCSTEWISRAFRRTGAASGSSSRITRSSRIATSPATSPSVCGCAATDLPRSRQRDGRAARARRPRRLRAPVRRDALRRRAAARGARPRARARAAASSCSTSRSGRSTGGFATGCSTISRASSTSSTLTAVYVTHDQTEAFTLGDRVAVMRDGRVVQVATPDELWARPVDEDVARFLGIANVDDGRDRPARGGGGATRGRATATAVVETRRPERARSCASSSGSTTGGCSRRSWRRSSTTRRETESTSRSTRKASFASDDPPPRRRPRVRAGRVLPGHGSPARRCSAGVAGWVRNNRDGTVEAVFEGDARRRRERL